MRGAIAPRTADGLPTEPCVAWRTVFGFFFCALVAFACTLSGNISKLEERVAKVCLCFGVEQCAEGKEEGESG